MKKLLSLVLTVLLLPIMPILAEDVPTEAEAVCVYRREEGFSRPENATPWSFFCAKDGEYLPLSCFKSGWFYEKNFNWDEGAVQSGKGMSAGEASDAVVAFTTPSDGEILIHGTTLTKSDQGDGVQLCITCNETSIYPANGWLKLLPGKSATLPDLVYNVRGGDVIRFRLNRLGNSDADLLDWTQTISYLQKKQAPSFSASVVSPIPSDAVKEPVSRSSDDFSRQEETSSWYFQNVKPNQNEYHDLDFIQYGWFSGELNNWTSGAVQAPGTAHPGVGGDAVFSYQCPKDGYLAVLPLTLDHQNAGSGDGVGIAILKNNTRLYPQKGFVSVLPRKTLTLPEFVIRVQKGDRIRFRVSALKNQSDDGVLIDPAVCYVSGVEDLLGNTAELSDISGHWAEEAVRNLYKEGVINGKADGRFDPEASVTRAEFVSMVNRALSVPHMDFQPFYTDVPFGAWYAEGVFDAFARDLIADELTPDNRFNPDAPITREEMTVILTDALLNERFLPMKQADLSAFSDAYAVESWAKDKVGHAVENGLILGNPDNTFAPKATATRAESAVIIHRLLTLVNTPPVEGSYNEMYGAAEYAQVDIEKLITDAYAAGKKSVTLPKGVYRVDDGGKQGHIVLKSMKDFTVNGYDTILLWENPTVPGFVLRDCENLTFNGLTLDNQRLSYFQGTVQEIARDRRSYILKLDPSYPHHLLDNMVAEANPAIGYFDENLRRIPNTAAMGDDIQKIGQYRYRVFCYDSPDNAKKRMEQIKVGTVANGMCKRAVGFEVHECGPITYNDCNIYSGNGGILEAYGTGGSVYRNLKIGDGPAPVGAEYGRAVSIGGGIFIASVKKGPLIENCTFSRTSDDTLDITSFYGRVAAQENEKTVIIGMSMNRDGLLNVGDTVRFSTPDNVQVAEAKIKSVGKTDFVPSVSLTESAVGGAEQSFPWFYRVTLDQAVSVEPRYLSVNVSLAGNGMVVRNCTYSNIHPRAILTHSNDMLIENCTFENITVSAIKFEPEVDWGEGGYVQNATVRGCTFKNCGTNIELSGTEDTCAISLIGYTGQDHRNIVIENSTFEGQYRQDIIASCVTGLTLKNNTFGPRAEDAEEYNFKTYPAITVFNSTDVRGVGNRFTDGRGIELAEDVKNVIGL